MIMAIAVIRNILQLEIISSGHNVRYPHNSYPKIAHLVNYCRGLAYPDFNVPV
jgi:hypothetical protein